MGRQVIPGGHPLFTPPHETLEVCQHERRPGTTVCLHCRHAARLAARARLKRVLLRGSAAAIVIATFIVAGALGATAIRDRVGSAPSAASSRSSVDPARQRAAGSARETAVAPTVIPSGTPASPRAAAAPAVTPAPRPAPPITPVLPMGKTQFPDSVIALRGDTDVVLSFDLTMVRTRRPAKFEQFVRATLPAVYGSTVRPWLAKIPDGGLAAQGDLLTELPSRGLRIPVGTGWALRLFPETRPGQEGPLVIRYRVSVVPERE